MPYAQINLAVDIVLIVILSLGLLPKYTKATLALFALYFIPWIFPLAPIKSKPPEPVKQEEVKKATVADLQAQVLAFDPKASPQETLSKTQDLYKQIFQVLGAATGTAPTANNPQQLQQLDPFQASGLSEQQKKLKEKITPDAVWFYLRIFWLLAAVYLYVQNANIGLVALVPSLIPIFYLARALPLAYEKIKSQPWMEQASKTVTDEGAAQTLLSEYSIVFAILLISLPTFLMFLLFFRQIKGTTSRGLGKYLKPDHYRVRFNGHLMDFATEKGDLLIEGMRFNAARLVQDPAQQDVWRLGSGTVIEFIPREPV